MQMFKKILVTGGAGFIGSNLVRKLINESDVEVVTLDKLTYAGNLTSLGDEVMGNPRHTFEEVDICDSDAVRKVIERHQPNAIMHLAAESHVDRSIDGPGEFIQTNIVGTFNLLQAARDFFSESGNSNFRFLHVSTDEVFGSLSPTDPGFSESTSYDPHSPYSASKASSDHLVRAWADTYGLPTLITNCSNNYGPNQFPEKLIPVVILKCLKNEPIPIYGKGDNIRDWLYVEDHVDALMAVLEGGVPGETYNVGGNNELQNIQLVRMLCVILDKLLPRTDGIPYSDQITYVTDRPGHDQRYAIDASKIKQNLGWQPKQDHASGFRKTVQWYLDNESWWQDILDGSYRLERLGKADS